MNLRLSNIKKVLDLYDADCYIVLNNADIRYLSNLVSSNIALLITKNKSYVLSDSRYKYMIESQNIYEPVICQKNLFADALNLIKELNLKNVLLDPNHISLKNYNYLKNELNIILKENITLDLRACKSEDELKNITTAQKIAEEAFNKVLESIKIGNTTKEIAALLNYLMELNGSEEAAFPTIVTAGAESANCHGVPGDYKIKDGDLILFDFGATYKGYRSDITRTIGIGNVGDFKKDIYKIVLNAHNKAVEVAKPGVKCSLVDKAARDYINSFGCGELFLHTTGHGVGLDIHEYPAVSFKEDALLRSGMVITIEPGIYIKNQFGVRIENTYFVSDEGLYTNTNIDMSLIIL